MTALEDQKMDQRDIMRSESTYLDVHYGGLVFYGCCRAYRQKEVSSVHYRLHLSAFSSSVSLSSLPSIHHLFWRCWTAAASSRLSLTPPSPQLSLCGDIHRFMIALKN